MGKHHTASKEVLSIQVCMYVSSWIGFKTNPSIKEEAAYPHSDVYGITFGNIF